MLSLKIAIESHIPKALDVSHAVQRTLDILVDTIADAQKGSLPPRVMSPALLMERSETVFPLSQLIPPFPSRWVRTTCS